MSFNIELWPTKIIKLRKLINQILAMIILFVLFAKIILFFLFFNVTNAKPNFAWQNSISI